MTQKLLASGGVLLLLFLVYTYFSRNKRKMKIRHMQMHVEGLQRLAEAQAVRAAMSMDLSKKNLENLALQADLKQKKLSEGELRVMLNAMEEMGKARSDELKGVLIPSAEVKVDKLLGKGGFGVVNLATFRGTKVAMKQLLQINDESVQRFR